MHLVKGMYKADSRDVLRYVISGGLHEVGVLEGTTRGAQLDRHQAPLPALHAEHDLLAALAEGGDGVTRELRHGRAYLDARVLVAPEIIFSNSVVVSHELPKYINNNIPGTDSALLVVARRRATWACWFLYAIASTALHTR